LRRITEPGSRAEDEGCSAVSIQGYLEPDNNLDQRDDLFDEATGCLEYGQQQPAKVLSVVPNFGK
jgi:hypothetical protein